MASANYDEYYASMVERLQHNFQIGKSEERRTEERILEGQTGVGSQGSIPASATLRVTGVYYYPEQNAKSHRTSKFELVSKGTPVFRRGQSFFLALRTPVRPFDETRDTVKLTFNYGPRPSPLIGTQFNLTAEKKPFDRNETSWAARIAGHDKNAISIEVLSSSDACVGIWKCSVETRTVRGGGRQFYESPVDIYLLFNPWNGNDITYMPDSDLLNEYILEDQGKVWFGPQKTARGRHWAFGQFSPCVLPLVMILLERAGLAINARGNPILISRALSKMVNSNDDNGLLVGRWDGKYQDGTAPSGWTGSVPILEQYFSTMRPVKYGQCWVFAAVLTTVARAIGIPARCVTNFVSAHDANCSLTIDIYHNERNEEIDFDPNNPNGGKDSIWNFHVWNDVWMARPDLPKGYGGWQAIDATPQERSEGSFQCGPASLEAIRKGQVGFAYDCSFILSEVNADLVHWKRDRSTPFGFSRMSCNNYHIGRMILTKKPGEFDPTGETDREDILSEYKSKEGSRAERLALIHAVRGTTGAPKYFELDRSPASDVEFDLVELEEVKLGEPFFVVVKITNKSTEVRSIQADLGAETLYYTGVRAKIVKKSTGKFDVDPGKTEELKMTVKPEDYMNKLVEYGIMKITGMCTVDKTDQSWFEEDDFHVIKPSLKVEVAQFLKLEEVAQVTFSFTNPLNYPLTQCKLNYEGPGFTRFGTIPLKDVGPLQEMKYTHSFVPKTPGTQTWSSTFTSKELIDIVGTATIEIS